MSLKGYLGFCHIFVSCTTILAQSLYSNDDPIIGRQFTMICNISDIAVYWYRNNNLIGESENQYTLIKPDGCKILTDPERYTFKHCGVKHELTIKSLNFDLDNGSVWSCQNRFDSIYSNNFTISVIDVIDPPANTIIPDSPVHGQLLTITCTNRDNVDWFRNGQQLNFEYGPTDLNGCYNGSNEIGTMYSTKCGFIYNITIVKVDYYRDNGSVFQCRSDTQAAQYTQYTLYVDVYPTLITTVEPVDGKSFDITCFSTFAVLWYRKGMDQDSYIASSSLANTNGCSVNTQFTDYYEFKSCGSVNQTLTIKSVDFNKDNGSKWNCSYGGIHDTYTLTVTRQPSIQQNGQRLVCVYKTYQKNMEFLPWKHTIDTNLVREIEGYSINDTVNSLNLTINQIDFGNYTCKVKVGITVEEAVYNYIPHQAPFLNRPTPTGELHEGDNAIFSVTYLEERSLDVSWYRDDKKLETTNRVTITEGQTEINHPYNNNIKLPGIVTILTISSVDIYDQGFYKSRICNQNGCSTTSFQLAIAVSSTKDDNGISVTETVIVGILALILLIVGIFVFIKCRKYRASNQSESSVRSVNESNVPTTAPVSNTLGPTIEEEVTDEHVYDRAAHVPSPKSEYTSIGPTIEEEETDEHVYDRAAHVPNPESEYTSIGPTIEEEETDEHVYDRAAHVPNPESEYTSIGEQSQYENSPNQPPSVYYNTASGISMAKPL